MNTISLLQLRNRLGETIDELRFTGKEVVVLKNNKPVAKIVPYTEEAPMEKESYLERVAALVQTIEPGYTLENLNPALAEIIGSGTTDDPRDYKERVTEYLKEKYA